MFEKTFSTYGSAWNHPLRVAWRKHQEDPETGGMALIVLYISSAYALLVMGCAAWSMVTSKLPSFHILWGISAFFAIGISVCADLVVSESYYLPDPPTPTAWTPAHTFDVASRMLGVSPRELYSDHSAMVVRAEEKLIQLARDINTAQRNTVFGGQHVVDAFAMFTLTHRLFVHLGLANENSDAYLKPAFVK